MTYIVLREHEFTTKVSRSCGEDDFVRVYLIALGNVDDHIGEDLKVVKSAKANVRAMHHGDVRDFGEVVVAWDSPCECRLVFFLLVDTIFRVSVRHGV